MLGFDALGRLALGQAQGRIAVTSSVTLSTSCLTSSSLVKRPGKVVSASLSTSGTMGRAISKVVAVSSPAVVLVSKLSATSITVSCSSSVRVLTTLIPRVWIAKIVGFVSSFYGKATVDGYSGKSQVHGYSAKSAPDAGN